MTIRLFLISSPLQAIVAENIRLQYLLNENDVYYAYCEGGRLANILHRNFWTEIIVGKNTRASIENTRKNIKANIEQLKPYLKGGEDKIVLYISDLSWLFNNTIFSFLKNNYKQNFECALFDEGTVTYRKTNFSLTEKARSLVKYGWLLVNKFPKLLVLSGAIPLNNIHIKKMYCYHPQLVSRISAKYKDSLQKKTVALDPKYLIFSACSVEISALDKSSVLFLSQPYYRIMPEIEYELCIHAMVEYFKAKGYKKFFLKPHDADKPEWLDKLSAKYSMHVFKSIQSIPVESLAPYLKCGVLVSVCSSSLLNLKLFGFEGKIISYGMNHCSCTRAIKMAHDNARFLYHQLGVETIG